MISMKICKFSKPPGKQPFERILFGRTSFGEQVAEFKNPEDGKIILSVPSAIHSHKPPLYGISWLNTKKIFI